MPVGSLQLQILGGEGRGLRLRKGVCWDGLHNNDSSRVLVQDLCFIKTYWAEYISRTHLLTQMLQPESPGISLVYAIHAYL